MTIEIIKTQIDDEDYDGNPESFKQVEVKINGALISERYSYPTTTADATIDSEVQADLTAKGYTW